MNEYYRQLISGEFRSCVFRTIERIEANPPTLRPFHTALLSGEAIFWSAFERSFSTSFGQRVLEEVARLAVLSNGADGAQRQRITSLTIDAAWDGAISEHIRVLRANGQTVSWPRVLAAVRSVPPTGQLVRYRVISDLWWLKDGIHHFLSLKTVKPNIDQTAVAKEDCLRLSAALPGCMAYFGLPYNPYGETKADYCFAPPRKIFDFQHDPVVLIGRELWDTLGGPGCYDQLLAIARDVGQETRPRIQALRAGRPGSAI